MKNIIADFTSKKCSTLKLKGLTQWDYGRVLEVRLENMPRTFEAHFSYKGFEDSLVVEVAPDSDVAIVPIPNIITTQDKDATCWIYYENETSGATYKTIILPITPRTKPSDYVYTETEVFTYKKLREELEAKIATAGRVKTVNGIEPDDAGNITVEVADGFSGEYNDLKGKTHYDTRKWVDVIDETCDSYKAFGACFISKDGMPMLSHYDMSNAQNAKIIWGDTEYLCDVKSVLVQELELYYAGNLALYGAVGSNLEDFGVTVEDTGEPFVVIMGEEQTVTAMCSSEFTGLHITISFEEGELKQLDEKYITDTIARTDHAHSWNDLTDKPFYEVDSLVEILNDDILYNGQHNGIIAHMIEDEEFCNKIVSSVGKSTRVVLDGTEYNTTVKSVLFGKYNMDVYYIGNGEAVKRLISDELEAEVTDEPYCFMEFGGIGFLMYFSEESNLTIHTIISLGEYEIKQLDEKFIPDFLKTHYDTRVSEEIEVEKNLTFDGVLEGKECVYLGQDGNLSGCLVKVSNSTYTKDEIIGSTFTITTDETENVIEIPENHIFDLSSQNTPILIISEMAAMVVNEDCFYNENYFTKGTWFIYMQRIDISATMYVSSSSLTHKVKELVPIEGSGELKQLDEKYIPDTIVRKDEVSGIVKELLKEVVNGNEVAY